MNDDNWSLPVLLLVIVIASIIVACEWICEKFNRKEK